MVPVDASPWNFLTHQICACPVSVDRKSLREHRCSVEPENSVRRPLYVTRVVDEVDMVSSGAVRAARCQAVRQNRIEVAGTSTMRELLRQVRGEGHIFEGAVVLHDAP